MHDEMHDDAMDCAIIEAVRKAEADYGDVVVRAVIRDEMRATVEVYERDGRLIERIDIDMRQPVGLMPRLL